MGDVTDGVARDEELTQMHADSLASYFVTMTGIAADLDFLARAELPRGWKLLTLIGSVATLEDPKTVPRTELRRHRLNRQ